MWSRVSCKGGWNRGNKYCDDSYAGKDSSLSKREWLNCSNIWFAGVWSSKIEKIRWKIIIAFL